MGVRSRHHLNHDSNVLPASISLQRRGIRWSPFQREGKGRLEYAPRLFTSLKLSTFDGKEIKRAFDGIDTDRDGVIQDSEVRALVGHVIGGDLGPEELDKAVAEFHLRFHGGKEGPVTFEQFHTSIREMATEVDRRVYPIALSMLLLGTSIGVIIPVMPVLVESIDLTPSEFGHVVGAFALSKLVGNIPAAVMVDRYGRKALLMYPLGLMTLGMVGVGLASSVEHLISARLLAGFGVALFSTAATLSMADISTKLNRASTMAPMMTAFSAGTVMGPAIGGLLGDTIGIRNCFFVVGGCYAALVPLNYLVLTETRVHPPRLAANQTMAGGFKAALESWRPLLREPKIRAVLLVNSVYWVSISGSSMTILPMLLTSKFHFTTSQLGTVYMCMSLVNVIGSQPLARLADCFGKRRGIVAGSALIGVGMAAVPMCESVEGLAGALGVWAVGTTTLGSTPTAHMTDLTTPKDRAQALALLRTCGDMGMLIGASVGGMLADFSSMESTMTVGAGVLLTSTAWFAIRNVIDKKRRLR